MKRIALAPFSVVVLAFAVGGCSDGTQADDGAGDGAAADGTAIGDVGSDVGTETHISADGGADASDAAAASDTTDAGSGDAGPGDTGPGDATSGDGASHSDAGDAGDAGCVTAAAPTKTIPASGALTIFDVGAGDLRLDLSADGKTALIEDAAKGDLFFYDTAKGTITKVGHVDGDPSTVAATSLSSDGSRIGTLHGATDIVGGVWSACSAAWTDLKSTHAKGCAGPPNNLSGVFGVNGNGTVAVGLDWLDCTAEAVMWKQSVDGWKATVLTHLGVAKGNNRATVISDDGSLIGGFAQRAGADRSPAIWKADGTGKLLEPTGDVVGEVLAVSPDGTMVAGQWNTVTKAGDSNNTSFYWTEKEGVVMVGTLPSPQADDFVWLMAIAAKNELILGSAGDPSWSMDLAGTEEFAVVWTKGSGLRKLQDLVTKAKVKIPDGIHLTAITAASADGTVILGVATDIADPTLAQHTFVLRLPVSAYGI